MATAPAISTRSLPSFEGLRPSTVRVSLVRLPLRAAGLTQRPVRGLVVRAATSIGPKVFHLCCRCCSEDMVDTSLPAFIDIVFSMILLLLTMKASKICIFKLD